MQGVAQIVANGGIWLIRVPQDSAGNRGFARQARTGALPSTGMRQQSGMRPRMHPQKSEYSVNFGTTLLIHSYTL